MSIVRAINSLFDLYFILLILRIFLTWIPSIDWNQQPTRFMRDITDAYLDIFRRIIPPAGMIDFSPIVALLVWQLLQTVVVSGLAGALG